MVRSIRKRNTWRARWLPLRDRHRKGAVLTAELLLVLPILFALFMAMCEFSMLWSANHQLKAASYAACREACLPAISIDRRIAAAQEAAERVLHDQRYIDAYRLKIEPGEHTGDMVVVELKLPMTAATPDLLGAIGISIKDKQLIARTCMRCE